jgi:uncharacterized protein
MVGKESHVLEGFVVHVGALRRAMGSRTHQLRRGTIEGLECQGSAVPEGGELELDVVLEAVRGGVAVTGVLRAPWEGQCRRCLGPASGVLVVEFAELYAPGADGEEAYPLVEETVDLGLMAHDAVLLELPQAPLCRPDCRGLCPRCGADRNVEPCDCQEASEPRLAVLELPLRDELEGW